VGVRAKTCETLAEYSPFTMLIFCEVPPPAICRLGSAGGAGNDRGWPPSYLSVRVALSPTVTFPRSSVAVKLAARRADGADQSNRRRKANRSRSPDWLRRRGKSLIHDVDLRIDTFA
jgi:hypothetical protein